MKPVRYRIMYKKMKSYVRKYIHQLSPGIFRLVYSCIMKTGETRSALVVCEERDHE